jgi:hypothetical protein
MAGSYLLAGFGIPGSTSSTLDGDRMNKVQQAQMQRQNALGFDYELGPMPHGPELRTRN